MTSLRVEGWRGINHSYAMVNQYQLLELLDYDGLTISHRDMPFYNAAWSPERNPSGFDAERLRRIQSIPAADDAGAADIVYRISSPYRFSAPKAGRLFVFGTSEFQNIDGDADTSGLDEGVRNNALTIVTPSRWSKVGFVKAGFPEARVAVVPHGVNCDIFKPSSPERRARVRKNIGLADGEFAMLFIGGMPLNKGPDLLIFAYALLRQRYKHVRLILKESSGLYSKRADKIFNELMQTRPDVVTEDVRASIINMPHTLSLDQLSALYGAADCYAAPYRAEGFNIPPLEAAACGIPVVITKGGSTDDYCDDSFALGIDGAPMSNGPDTFIEPDLESFLAQLTALIEGRAGGIDPAAAVRLISEKHSWTAVTAQLMDVLSRQR